MASHSLSDCIVLLGPDLEPWRCRRFSWSGDRITEIDRVGPVQAIEGGALVVMPGLINAHTHVGDACWPDGATGLTLEEGFFRPDGFKYRELARIDPKEQLRRVTGHLRAMARSGTVLHIDFREQGRPGAELLRAASEQTGVDSVILSQFNTSPFSEVELQRNTATLPPGAEAELSSLLDVADGFSESTMNDLTDAAWRRIRDVTTERGRLRAIHCLENEGYRDVSLMRTGRGDLARALELLDPHLVIHLTVANEHEARSLAAARCPAVLNPRANASLGLPLPPVRLLLDSAVTLLLGTDNGLLNSPNLFSELDFTYRLAKSQYGDAVHPDPRDILRMATSNLPRTFGEERQGVLETGRPATFVILDFTQPHLAFTRHLVASVVTRVTPADILATLRQGRLLYVADNYRTNLPLESASR